MSGLREIDTLEMTVFILWGKGVVTPLPTSHQGGARGRRETGTGTLYLLFQTLVCPSLITKSKYLIQRYKNKTTTVVVFRVLIHIVLSPVHIYIYKKTVYLHLHIQSAEPTCGEPLLVC